MIGHSFTVKEASCPNCKKRLDRAAAVQHDCSPVAGDVTICIGCGEILTFTSDLDLAVLGSDAFAALPADSREQLHQLREAIRARGR